MTVRAGPELFPVQMKDIGRFATGADPIHLSVSLPDVQNSVVIWTRLLHLVSKVILASTIWIERCAGALNPGSRQECT